MTDIVDRLNGSLSAGYSELRKEAALEIERLRAKIEQMEKQVPICRAEDLRHAEILLPSLGLMPEDKLYALPGAQAQPASSIPVEAIGKMLADVMAVAVSNGANSVSMPDEYVEVAVWLQGECPTQPAPSVPEGWQLVPIEPTQEMLDATSWPNCAGTDYKKMLAAAPRSEAKP